MNAAIRFGVQVVLFFLLLGVVIGFATPETGIAEKAALVVLAGGLVWLAVQVRKLPPRTA